MFDQKVTRTEGAYRMWEVVTGDDGMTILLTDIPSHGLASRLADNLRDHYNDENVKVQQA